MVEVCDEQRISIKASFDNYDIAKKKGGIVYAEKAEIIFPVSVDKHGGFGYNKNKLDL